MTWYRFLLLFFPTRFRREYASDLLQLARERMNDARMQGHVAALRQAARLIRDAITQATLEHWTVHRSRHRRSRARQAMLNRQTPLLPANTRRIMLETMIQDIRFAWRGFRKTPGFTLVAILTLALGIGSNTAIFSLIDGVLLRPLKYGEPEELVVVWETNAAGGFDKSWTSTALFYDWREQSQTMTDLTGWAWDTFILGQEGDTESQVVNGILVYPNFFKTLAVRPLLGRPFTEADAQPDEVPTVTIVSHRLWRDRWGADPSLVGRTITIRGLPLTVVGVMPPDVAVPRPEVDLWVPMAWRVRGIYWERYNRWLEVYGRLRPGVTVEQASADVARITASLTTGDLVPVYDGWSARVESLQHHVVGPATARLWVTFAAVGLVLLIACVNIANMLLARTAAREHEVSVRRALGATGRRIWRQLLTESVILSLAGGTAGVALAYVTHRGLIAAQPDILPRAAELGLNTTALGFALLVSIAVGLLFGLAPALYSRRIDLQQSLKDGGIRGSTSGSAHGRLRGVLVATQLALTVTLLCGAGLLLRSLLKLGDVDPGFDPQGSIVALVDLDDQRYDDDDKIRMYYDQLLEGLAAIPGVESIGASSALPMDPMGINYDLPYRLVGQEDLETHELPSADFRVVSPGYFETMRIPVIRGRTFTEYDTPDAPLVALVNQAMADLVWPNADPVGERMETPSVDWTWFEVVGVVGDTRYYGLGSESKPEIYVAHSQVPRNYMSIAIRTAADPAALTSTIRREVLAQDQAQPAHTVVPMEDLVADSIASERFYALLLSVFAAVALVLSAVGVYGVLSYWVNQRTHEIGIRIALGADRAAVVGLVIRRGMGLAILGAAVGLGGAFGVTRVLDSVLFDVEATDPLTFAAVAGLLLSTAFVACWLPAFRASRLDPVGALRE
jgi:predicted permease